MHNYYNYVLSRSNYYTATTTSRQTPVSDTTEQNAISTVVVPVIVSIIVVAVVVIALLVIVCLKTRNQRCNSSKVHQLQSVNAVLNSKTREDEKIEESYMDHQYDVI